MADDILNERKFTGNLVTILTQLDSFIEDAVIMQHPVPVSILKEKKQFNYPKWAIRELLMNAIMHRDYESNSPIKFYQFDDRIEVVNSGGLYGNARPENFPNINDYRNPVIAEAMKTLGYVNRFNRGIARVQAELKGNLNPEAIFDFYKSGVFSVKVMDASIKEYLIEPDKLTVQKEPLTHYTAVSEEVQKKFGRNMEKQHGE